MHSSSKSSNLDHSSWRRVKKVIVFISLLRGNWRHGNHRHKVGWNKYSSMELVAILGRLLWWRIRWGRRVLRLRLFVGWCRFRDRLLRDCWGLWRRFCRGIWINISSIWLCIDTSIYITTICTIEDELCTGFWGYLLVIVVVVDDMRPNSNKKEKFTNTFTKIMPKTRHSFYFPYALLILISKSSYHLYQNHPTTTLR